MIRRLAILVAWEVALFQLWDLLMLLVRGLVAWLTMRDPEPALEAIRSLPVEA